jgi:hypothetical protein
LEKSQCGDDCELNVDGQLCQWPISYSGQNPEFSIKAIVVILDQKFKSDNKEFQFRAHVMDKLKLRVNLQVK